MHRAASFIQPLRTVGLGLGLVLAVLSGRCVAADWSLPDSRMGIRTAPLLLMTRPDVQADLKLEAEQVASLHKTIEELSQRAQALRGKTGPEVVAERRSIDDAQGRWLTDNLREDQLARLVTRSDRGPVQLEQATDHADVTDVGNVSQSARPAAKEGGHHGLGHEILRAADTDLAFQRGTAVDKQNVVGHGARVPGDGRDARRSPRFPLRTRPRLLAGHRRVAGARAGRNGNAPGRPRGQSVRGIEARWPHGC